MSPDGASARAAKWLESGLLDVEFYAALRGREFGDPAEAAEDLVEEGMPRLLSPHPLLDVASLPPETRRAWRQGRVRQVLAQLAGDDGLVQPVGPLAESPDPTGASAQLLALAARLGRESAADGDPSSPPVDRPSPGGQPRQTGLTSVVVVASQVRPTTQAVQSLLRHAAGHAVQVVVVDPGSPAHVALGLGAAFFGQEEVELLRVPGTTSAPEAANLGLARAAGEIVVLLQPHVRPRRGWLTPVLAVMADPAVAGAQPVVLGPDDTIDSAGLAVLSPGAGPVRLLAGHPKEDARRLEGERLAAISGEAMVLRTDDVVAVGGLDPSLPWTDAALDLAVRLREAHPAGFRVAPTALVSSARSEQDSADTAMSPRAGLAEDRGILERIGFAVETRGPDGQGAGPTPVVTGRLAVPAGQLRWSLKLPSAPGQAGDRWGDTHFADALAEALRGLGQEVVTCRRGAHGAGPTHLDDVSLAVRGLYPVPPVPGQVNLLWVISHPDDVDPAELGGYDLVFAASGPWSRSLSASSGREVIPLLQATEFVPPPAGAASTAEPGVVFVGAASQERERPLVWKAVEAGVPLAVYGPGWHALPDGIWRGDYVDNSALPELYHRHGIVLADHWPDMARQGFIANRVFDAVASGARVICDDVAGIHEVFDPRDVVVARTSAEVAAAVEDMRRGGPPEDVPRPSLSFADRARALLDQVSRL